MQLSALIGKPVVTSAGETLGYVKSVFLGKKLNALSSLTCVDGEEEEFYLPARALLAVGDAVTAGNARLREPTGIESPIGKPVYGSRGEYLGAASEFTFDENEAFLTAVKDGEQICVAASRLALGDSVIVNPRRAKRSPAKRPAGTDACRAKRPAAACPSEACSFETCPAEARPAEGAEERAPAEPTPCRAQSACTQPTAAERAPAAEWLLYDKNLLGKRLKKPLVLSGEILFDAGELITPAVIRTAAEHNRLLELSANTFGS